MIIHYEINYNGDMDLKEKIDYWIEIAIDDLDSADIAEKRQVSSVRLLLSSGCRKNS